MGLEIQDGQFYWCEPPATKLLDSVKGAPGQGKKRSLLSVFGGLKLRKGPAVGTGKAKDSGMYRPRTVPWVLCNTMPSVLHHLACRVSNGDLENIPF